MNHRLNELYETRSKIDAEIGFLEASDVRKRDRDVERTANACMAQAAAGGCERSPEEVIADLFSWHPPQDEATVLKYEALRESAKHFAMMIWKSCPFGADRTAAIRKVREAVMTANAAIALDGRGI